MSLWPFQLNGSWYSLSNFDGLAYVNGIPDSMNDLTEHVNGVFFSQTSGSVTIGTGFKSFSIDSNLRIRQGDYLVIYLSFGNWCSGTVQSYNSSTGAIQMSCDKFSGAGTGFAWVTKAGDSLLSNTVVAPLDPVFGGTGAGGPFSGARANTPGNQFGSSTAGMGASLWDSMVEVFDDFFAFGQPTDARNSGDQPRYALASPYYFYNVGFMPTSASGAEFATGGNFISNLAFGSLSMKQANPLVQSSVVTYGQNGFVLCGNGTLHFECLVAVNSSTNANPSNYKEPTFRWGLRAQNSGQTGNIFSYGGIGFERLSTSNRKLNVVLGKNGSVYRQMLPTTMIDKDYVRLGFTVSADGNLVQYFVDGNKVLELYMACPTSGLTNLLHPAFEIQNSGGNNNPGMSIEALWLRKNLQR